MPLKLPRFDQHVSLVDEQGKPTQTFHRWWQEIAKNLESTFNDLEQAVLDIQEALDTAEAAAREAARINSYTNPGSVLSATDAGSDATITVANHTRIYPVQGIVDVADVAITGGTITGLAYSTTYYVYYDDTTLASTTPTYLTTTVAADAQVGAAAGRHCLGYITTPAAGGGGTSGSGTGVPGGTGGGGSGGTSLP